MTDSSHFYARCCHSGGKTTMKYTSSVELESAYVQMLAVTIRIAYLESITSRKYRFYGKGVLALLELLFRFLGPVRWPTLKSQGSNQGVIAILSRPDIQERLYNHTTQQYSNR